MNSWIDYGYEANERLRKEQAEIIESRNKRRNMPRRFWLRKGEKTKVILLDDKPACVWEYDVKIDDSWGNYFTCTRAITGVPLPFDQFKDKIQFNRHYMGFLTIIDCTEFKDRAGVLHRNTKKILPITSKTLEKFANWKSDRGTLVGAKFIVTRTNTEKAERIGDDWQFLEKVDLTAIVDIDGNPVDTTPVNYEEFLAPRSEAETNEIVENLVGVRPASTHVGSYTEETSDSNEVPF